MDETSRNQMQERISKWIRALEEYPGLKEWTCNRISYTMNFDFEGLYEAGQNEFMFSREVEEQRQLIMRYIELILTIDALRECEYYFRRYPFRGLPVTYSGHMRNICEMYFSRCYEYKQKLREYLNALKISSQETISVGNILKAFDREFRDELRYRNQIHHQRRYSEIGIDRIFLLQEVVGRDKRIGDLGELEARREYKRATKDWVRAVRTTATKMEEFLEYVSRITLDSRTFLTL